MCMCLCMCAFMCMRELEGGREGGRESEGWKERGEREGAGGKEAREKRLIFVCHVMSSCQLLSKIDA